MEIKQIKEIIEKSVYEQSLLIIGIKSDLEDLKTNFEKIGHIASKFLKENKENL